MQTIQLLKVIHNTLSSSQSTGNKVSKSYSNLAKQLKFSLCNESHEILKCDIFLNIQAKQLLNHVKETGNCCFCLQPYSRNHTFSKPVCGQCRKIHHTFLHIDRQIQQMTRGQQRMVQLQMQEAT